MSYMFILGSDIINYVIEKKMAFMWLIFAVVCGISAYKNIQKWRK
ncbi:MULTISPECIES: hypothetical protein [Clostridium]|uniref:Uncharacterized protein n=1 Tax=Clostridium beijerinckii TaxID=1520 RepID=A0A1S8S8Y8_CLOBE|nr:MULTISPECIES: hypothetical protein [Clostridium]NRT74876.1 hypothetical protein [Clostridium beijerinckii]NRY61241.1 hypothetical protein [Clostridium beijerinckii]OOM61873.1 hypothetical protein CLBCK_20480 [Clostridium beijerinckii]